MPCVRSARLANGNRLLPAATATTLSTSSPAQKARPSPDSTTARTLRSSLSRAPASAIARNIAGSSAFILSARLSRTSAIPSAIVSRMRSSMGYLLVAVIQNAATALPLSPGIAVSGSQMPGATGVPLEHGRAQSERLLRDATNPEIHALDVNLNENCARSLRLSGKIGGVGVLPEPTDLGSVLDQYGLAAQHNESIVLVLLEDESDLAHAPNLGCLARAAAGNETDGPVVLVGVGQHTSHWPRVGAAGPGFGQQPAIPHAGDRLCSACEQPVYFRIIAPVFRSWHEQILSAPILTDLADITC